MENRCRRCEYSCPVNVAEGGEWLLACLYILKTGRRRPCPPGRECTVRKLRGRGKNYIIYGRGRRLGEKKGDARLGDEESR